MFDQKCGGRLDLIWFKGATHCQWCKNLSIGLDVDRNTIAIIVRAQQVSISTYPQPGDIALLLPSVGINMDQSSIRS